METKHFIHEFLKNTNMERPTPNLIGYNEFPSQNNLMINTIIPVTYVDEGYIADKFNQDSHDIDDHENREFTKDFIVARMDNFVFDDSPEYGIEVFVSTDYSKVIVHHKYKTMVSFVPIEVTKHLVGLRVYPEYPEGTEEREAYIFSVQDLETGLATIIEYLDDKTYRIILDTEMYFQYNPDDIIIPEEIPDTAIIRKQLMEGRSAYNG